jgi:hypothetical protein
MITLISATPGSGKTLWAVKEIFARANEADPWNIFSNIDGLKLDTAQPLRDSFEDYPPRSLVVIDEAQRIKHFSKNYKHPVKNEMHPEVQFLETHRHADHLDIIYITQAPRRLHADVLDMVGMHYHLHRPMGMKMATWWLWRHHQLNPNTKSVKADAEDSGTFTYPKHLFDMYKSSDGGDDSHSKIKIPMKIINAVWMLCLVLGVTAYLYMSSQPSDKEETVQNESSQTIEKSIPESANTANTQTAPHDNESLDTFCRKGINVEKTECVNWFNNLSSSNATVTPQQVSYNPNKPYEFEYISKSEPLDFPRMSGVIKLSSGKLMAIDQQGNYMPKISQYDCKQWLSGFRPFDYYRKEKPPEPVQQIDSEIQIKALQRQIELIQQDQSQRSAGESENQTPNPLSL